VSDKKTAGNGARPCFLNIERFERLERFERPMFASDRGFGKIDKIVGSDPGDSS